MSKLRKSLCIFCNVDPSIKNEGLCSMCKWVHYTKKRLLNKQHTKNTLLNQQDTKNS